jgi:iron complex outermembrane receptor protein
MQSGSRANINYKDQLLALPMEISLGTEMQYENYDITFRNLYQSQPGKGSVQGEKSTYIKQNRNYSNYFLQMLFSLRKLHLRQV